MPNWNQNEPLYGVNFVNFRGLADARMKPINVFPMVMLLIVVVMLIAWLGGYFR